MQSAVALHENSKGETYALRAKCSTIQSWCNDVALGLLTTLEGHRQMHGGVVVKEPFDLLKRFAFCLGE